MKAIKKSREKNVISGEKSIIFALLIGYCNGQDGSTDGSD